MRPIEGYVTTEPGIRLFYQQLGDGPVAVIIPNALFMFEDFRRLEPGRTLIFIDWRARGRSDAVTNPASLARGIHHDIDDLEAVRRHFGFEKVAVIGHSYSGSTAALYALKHPQHAYRVVQIGPIQPFLGKDYPPHLKNHDKTYQQVMTGLQDLEQQRAATEPVEFCRKFWDLLRVLFVLNPRDTAKLRWDPCESANERDFGQNFRDNILPSLMRLNETDFAGSDVQAPVLTIHAKQDRSAPYGGGREWAYLLRNARLLTLDGAGHFPWIEQPDAVFGAIEAFFDGRWPAAASEVVTVDDESRPTEVGGPDGALV